MHVRVSQAMIAERISSVESLDLYRHALELHHHPQACFGFACHVIKATTHATNADAEQTHTWMEQASITQLQSPDDAQVVAGEAENASQAKARIPRGYGTQYIAQAVVAASKYTALHPDNACAWNLLGLLLERQQLHAGAVNAFKRSVAILSSDNTATPRLKISKLNLARALCANKMYNEAIENYQAAGVEHFPQICGLGLAAYRAGSFPVSYQVFEQALAVAVAANHKIRVAGVHVALAIIAHANNDLDLSKQLLFKAVADPRLCPRALFVMCGLGLQCDDGVLASSALAEFPKLRSNGVKDANQHVADLHWLTSCLLRLQGHAKFARNALLKSVRTFPNSSEMWTMVAEFMTGNPSLMVVDWEDLACKRCALVLDRLMLQLGKCKDMQYYRIGFTLLSPLVVNMVLLRMHAWLCFFILPRYLLLHLCCRLDSASPCAEAAGAVRSQNIDKTPGKALGLMALGMLVAGRDQDVQEAFRCALKAVHENPTSADSWSVVAISSYAKSQ